jgi:hypothetical protein
MLLLLVLLLLLSGATLTSNSNTHGTTLYNHCYECGHRTCMAAKHCSEVDLNPAHLSDTDSFISTAIITAVSAVAYTSQAIRSTIRTDSMLTSNDAARCVNGR